MRDLRTGSDPSRNGSVDAARRRAGCSASLAELLDRFGESTIETWSDDEWEGFTLQALWRVCCDGVRDLPPFTPAAASGGPPPRPAVRGDRRGRRPARPRRADPVLRRVPRPGLRPLAAAPPRRGILSRVLRLVPPAGGPPDRWLRGLARGARPPGGRGDRPAGIDPRIARAPRRRRGGVGRLPLGHAARPARLGRHGPAGRVTRRPGGPPGPGGEPRRVPGGPAAAGPVRAGPHGARRPRLLAGRSTALRDDGPRADRGALGRRASSSGPSSCSSSPRSSACRPTSSAGWTRQEWATLVRGDRGVLRAGAPPHLPPGLRAPLPHPDARRPRPARPAAARTAARRPGSRRSSASTSARSRSAATSRRSPPTSRRSARPASSAWPCTTAGRPTPTSSRSARS